MNSYKFALIKIWLVNLLVVLISSCTYKNSDFTEKQKIELMKDSVLSKYSFSSNIFDSKKLGYLAGNSEMGGIVLKNGLGFDSIWCSDLWETSGNRIPLQGVKIVLENMNLSPADPTNYTQQQSLKTGIVVTDVQLQDDKGYQSKIFFSADEKRMLIIKLKNKNKKKSLCGVIRLPVANYRYTSSWPEYEIGFHDSYRFIVERNNNNKIVGVSYDTLFTPGAWSIFSSGDLDKSDVSNQFKIEIAPETEQSFYFTFVTKWQTDNYINECRQLIEQYNNYSEAEEKHKNVWAKDWELTPLLLLPDSEHEKLFYQSVFWLLSTSGSNMFLPGESQFGSSCWYMRPFTYGAAGWATLAYIQLGHFEKAKKMLMNHYKPIGMIDNARIYLGDSNREKNAYSFAHEIKTDGTTTGICDDQRHLNGFALALFHKYYVMTGDEEFFEQYLYPVAMGVAEFWSELAIWNESVDGYIFPKLRSVSEDLFEESLLDIVLSAKWSLEIAVHYSKFKNSDDMLRKRWTDVLSKLYIPQNDKFYLEFLGDTEEREYLSYQGIRAPVYLGYPTNELTNTLDSEKAKNTLQHAWTRNYKGKGMLGFIASWYSLSTQSYGMGDLALQMAEQNFNCYDESKTALCEGPENLDRYYFLTTTASYLLFPLNMLVQNYENEIVPFSAIPSNWRNIVFYDLPGSNGTKVSGSMKNGNVENIIVKKDNKILHKTNSTEKIVLK